MNLLTNVQKDLLISNCSSIHSFEDKVLIHIENIENYPYKTVTQKLLKLSEKGEIQLLDEKTNSDYFYGSGNLGILSST